MTGQGSRGPAKGGVSRFSGSACNASDRRSVATGPRNLGSNVAPKVVLLLEPNRVAAEALERTLEGTGRYRGVVLVGGLRELARIDLSRFDIACLQDDLPDGFGATEGVVSIRMRSQIAVVVRTGIGSPRRAALARALGACFVVAESDGLVELLTRIDGAAAGQRYDHSSDRDVVEAALGLMTARRHSEDLTPSEIRVAVRLGPGVQRDAIARDLGMSRRTVERTITRIRSKVGKIDDTRIRERALVLGLLRTASPDWLESPWAAASALPRDATR